MHSHNNEPPGFDYVREETRQLTFLWGLCCCSPLVYLSVAWLVQRGLDFEGLYKVTSDTWRMLLLSAAVIAVLLQTAHFIIRLRLRNKLETSMADPKTFMATLSWRTYGLIFMSEIPVFLGFLLWLLQGSLTPIFGFGIASMLLYAQSHPRSANPAFEDDLNV
jgi:hypothetical protein